MCFCDSFEREEVSYLKLIYPSTCLWTNNSLQTPSFQGLQDANENKIRPGK